MRESALLPFRGVFPVLSTPCQAGGGVNRESLRRPLRHVCALGGADGMTFPGYNSKWWKLSETEIFKGAGTILEARQSAVRVVLNGTAPATTPAPGGCRC